MKSHLFFIAGAELVYLTRRLVISVILAQFTDIYGLLFFPGRCESSRFCFSDVYVLLDKSCVSVLKVYWIGWTQLPTLQPLLFGFWVWGCLELKVLLHEITLPVTFCVLSLWSSGIYASIKYWQVVVRPCPRSSLGRLWATEKLDWVIRLLAGRRKPSSWAELL